MAKQSSALDFALDPLNARGPSCSFYCEYFVGHHSIVKSRAYNCVTQTAQNGESDMPMSSGLS